MKRRALLITSVGVLGGCLQNGAENTQGSDGTDQEEDDNGMDQETESNGTAEEPDSNTTDQDNTANGTDQGDPVNGSDHTTEPIENEQTATSNGTTQDNTTNGSAQEEEGNGADQDDRETRTYEIKAETPSDTPIRHEFEITQPDIHSPDSPLTLTASISNRTDETVSYADKGQIIGSYLVSGEFILVPKDEHEYSFDDEQRMWFSTDLRYDETGIQEKLQPDGTRAQDLVMIRRPLKEFPDEVPMEFNFSTSFGVEKESDDAITDYEHTVAFSLVATL
ncbi:hypothetical protein [Saliphagus sp. LR7]|uniref:hypothetical protein n=1 Tax=Saliphagus sp. LR7 TaxID=2282654 RepID=UPI000DF74CE4|nr:hypothetical protein [Saliphagus sp. LR7]